MTKTQGQPGPEPATDATQRTLTEYRRRSLASVAFGAVMALIGAGLSAWADEPSDALTVVGMVTLVGGLLSLLHTHRMRRTLKTHPWAHRLVEVHRDHVIVLRDPASDIRIHLKATRNNPARRPTENGPLWWSGTPEHGGVLSTPGGDTLTWVRPLVRRHARYRWVLLLGLIVGGLGVAGSTAADHDPMVELKVIDDTTQAGPCRVSLKDPLTHEHRTATFICEGHRDKLIPDLEYGWVVSYGPWKGDLYNADWEGSTGNDVNDGLIGAGLLLTAVGGIGGAVSHRERRRFPDTAPTRRDRPVRTPLPRRAARATLVATARTRRTLRRRS
ncbi:hypothetical protein V2W30_23535 [Streptomyces sp. Q6]|uniref:Uncharacterized protein n=1 Tax=Streptomyces citrinus TaxID=3118173 RepID=A0ACD5AGI1_9ACTN